MLFVVTPQTIFTDSGQDPLILSASHSFTKSLTKQQQSPLLIKVAKYNSDISFLLLKSESKINNNGDRWYK